VTHTPRRASSETELNLWPTVACQLFTPPSLTCFHIRDSHFLFEILFQELRKADVKGLTSILGKPTVNQFA
jgi:hypothetical protein